MSRLRQNLLIDLLPAPSPQPPRYSLSLHLSSLSCPPCFILWPNPCLLPQGQVPLGRPPPHRTLTAPLLGHRSPPAALPRQTRCTASPPPTQLLAAYNSNCCRHTAATALCLWVDNYLVQDSTPLPPQQPPDLNTTSAGTITDVEGTVHDLPSASRSGKNKKLYAEARLRNSKAFKPCRRCSFPCDAIQEVPRQG